VTGEKIAAAASEAVKASLNAISLGGDDEKHAALPPPPPPPPGAGGAAAAAAAAAAAVEEEHAAVEETRVADLICDRCAQPLLDDDGVAAMDKQFHVNCFCCEVCVQPFRDAPYFERRDKVYCRNDYLSLFGKTVCAGCMEPLVKGDRAMAAAGRMYHPHHFACEGCGDQFAPDAQFYERDNAPYCAKCNLRLFGTCAGCSGQITPERPAVSALGRNWHLACIKCFACGGGFPDGSFYTHDDDGGTVRAYCENDYLELYAPRCRACKEPVKDAGTHACGASWHSACFVCTTCKTPFTDGAYFEMEGRPYCTTDYYEAFGTKCAGCGGYVTDELVNAIGKAWHPGHFACGRCGKPFADMEYYEKDGKAYDETCYCELFCPVYVPCSFFAI